MNKNIGAIIADNLLDNYLAFDSKSKTSFVIMVVGNSIIVSGEFTSNACVSVPDIVRNALYRIDSSEINPELYTVLIVTHEFAHYYGFGVERDLFCIGADSSEVVFGYATNETENYMPVKKDMYINSVNLYCGCDPSKIKRAATYAARHIAKNLVAAGISDEITVQVAYVDGIAKPLHLSVNTCNKSKIKISDGEISRIVVDEIFDMRPKAIEERLKLRNPIFAEAALQGHFGQQPQKVIKIFHSRWEGEKKLEIELFTWEKLDCVDKIKNAFNLK